MIKSILKYPYHKFRGKVFAWKNENFVRDHIKNHRASPENFDFIAFKNQVLAFIKTLQTDEEGIQFRYSEENTKPSLYASAYACMTLSLLGELKGITDPGRSAWKAYFDSFQREDGLFYDPIVHNEHYDNSDWWGARHLALHMISVYTDLNERPRIPFRFLESYYDPSILLKWLQENEAAFEGDMANDFDNKLMNVTCLLQYQRDTWKDDGARKAVELIQKFLLEKINSKTGIWGDDHISNPDIRSRKIQFAYHLFPIFFYDGIYSFDIEKVVAIVLKTQNAFGGFGVVANSSACEDIDSIDILIRLTVFSTGMKDSVDSSLKKGFRWVLLNQMEDGGFIFRLNERFVYGHEQMSSGKNKGAIFPTWFRVLSIAYLCRYFSIPNNFIITPCPGYEF
jgi:hypothetical protein